MITYPVISFELSQLHVQLKSQKGVNADGLNVEDAAHCLKLLTGQVVKGDFIFKQLGKLEDLLGGWPDSLPANLQQYSIQFIFVWVLFLHADSHFCCTLNDECIYTHESK